MKRSWYSDMQRLGRRTGFGMRMVIRVARSSATHKAAKRCVKCDGPSRPMFEGSDIMLVPVMVKRSKRILWYRADIPAAPSCGQPRS